MASFVVYIGDEPIRLADGSLVEFFDMKKAIEYCEGFNKFHDILNIRAPEYGTIIYPCTGRN